jgi:hypothetical protein
VCYSTRFLIPNIASDPVIPFFSPIQCSPGPSGIIQETSSDGGESLRLRSSSIAFYCHNYVLWIASSTYYIPHHVAISTCWFYHLFLINLLSLPQIKLHVRWYCLSTPQPIDRGSSWRQPNRVPHRRSSSFREVLGWLDLIMSFNFAVSRSLFCRIFILGTKMERAVSIALYYSTWSKCLLEKKIDRVLFMMLE